MQKIIDSRFKNANGDFYYDEYSDTNYFIDENDEMYLPDGYGNYVDDYGNKVDSDGNSVKSGKSGGGFFEGTTLNSLLGFATTIFGNNNNGNNSGSGSIPRTRPEVVGGNRPPISSGQTPPIVTTNNNWVLPVAIGGGVVLVGLIGILVFKKSK